MKNKVKQNIQPKLRNNLVQVIGARPVRRCGELELFPDARDLVQVMDACPVGRRGKLEGVLLRDMWPINESYKHICKITVLRAIPTWSPHSQLTSLLDSRVFCFH